MSDDKEENSESLLNAVLFLSYWMPKCFSYRFSIRDESTKSNLIACRGIFFHIHIHDKQNNSHGKALFIKMFFPILQSTESFHGWLRYIKPMICFENIAVVEHIVHRRVDGNFKIIHEIMLKVSIIADRWAHTEIRSFAAFLSLSLSFSFPFLISFM